MKPFLFLDRDGTVNRQMPPGQYVTTWSQFEFLPGALDAIKRLSGLFSRVIIVTNQQGVAKGLMTESDLHEIHENMLMQIRRHGGRVDAVYYCPHLDGTCTCRKPQIGMGLAAQRDFPEIEFHRTTMVGDQRSDVEFAHNMGAHAFLLSPYMTLYRWSRI